MDKIIGQRLPESREATIRLQLVTQRMINVGTPLECCVKFFGNTAGPTSYKYPWFKRVWYTSTIGSRYWKAIG